MSLYTSLARPIAFRFDAEAVHHLAIRLGRGLGWASPLIAPFYCISDPSLQTEVCGLRFDNPVGLAAGFDKSGDAVRLLAALGFGHIEIGSVSALASDGNPAPRLWRLPDDEAIIVHYGLPNAGAEAVARRVEAVRLPVPLGINLVKTNLGPSAPPDKDEDIIEDYVRSARRLKDSGQYLSLNLSCPNTENGRDFFAEKIHIVRCLEALSELDISCPVFLKVSPLGGIEAIERVLEAADAFDLVSGFIFNLSPTKPDGLKTPRSVWHNLPGAVSGPPCRALMNHCITELYRRMDNQRYRIIGAGGIASADDAYSKIKLGASLVQVLTAMIYHGPGVAKAINEGLAARLRRDGFRNIAEAVGAEAV